MIFCIFPLPLSSTLARTGCSIIAATSVRSFSGSSGTSPTAIVCCATLSTSVRFTLPLRICFHSASTSAGRCPSSSCSFVSGKANSNPTKRSPDSSFSKYGRTNWASILPLRIALGSAGGESPNLSCSCSCCPDSGSDSGSGSGSAPTCSSAREPGTVVGCEKSSTASSGDMPLPLTAIFQPPLMRHSRRLHHFQSQRLEYSKEFPALIVAPAYDHDFEWPEVCQRAEDFAVRSAIGTDGLADRLLHGRWRWHIFRLLNLRCREFHNGSHGLVKVVSAFPRFFLVMQNFRQSAKAKAFRTFFFG